ncbi:polyprenyl synthetase family protein [Brevibacterium moorei]|uniref:polyprenyl synthetase family protein n=1 Tax=Brevibacterium moorei TaxID=2968457 RepID=UPI00211D0C94|nr:polyprenyl synthetase family protein [Brevibacterium sp. 68QC2CO]MCQ9385592.1 polyprenyl synthetase family protein [Brevibacterium sp. 68QC2CO]
MTESGNTGTQSPATAAQAGTTPPEAAPASPAPATTTQAISMGMGAVALELADYLEQVEDVLGAAARQTDPLVDAAAHHLMNAGGKRARPMLVLMAAGLGDRDRPQVITAAAAVELTHLATLYHDDVMDEAPVRRGATAAQHVWGNNVAILTGDLLFAKASLLSADLGPRAVVLQAETFERLVLGQLHETIGPVDGADPLRHHLGVLADKTGSLIAAATEFGLLASGAPEEYIAPLRSFGERVGVAFQLADDIIDLDSAPDQSGKTPGTDLREGVPTLPMLYVRAAAAAGDADAVRVVELMDRDLSSDEALETARVALVAHPAMERARAEARRWVTAALDDLAPLPAGGVKDDLIAFAHQVVNRVG